MSGTGWIKLHRKILDSRHGQDHEMIGLFVVLLLKANHKEGFTRDGTKIRKGSFMTSQLALSKLFKMDRSTLRRKLKKLSDSGQIEQQPSNKNTIITITNWSNYQEDEHQVNIKRTTSEQQVNTNKNVNNNKNKKNIYDIDKIYELYPKKAGKKNGILKLQKIIKNQEIYNIITQGVIDYSLLVKNESRKPQHIKAFSSWVNQEGWMDKVEAPLTIEKLESDFLTLIGGE